MAVVTVEPKQVASLVNDATTNILGGENLISEDLTNTVDIGVKLENANAYKTFVEGLALAIAKTIFVERKYSSMAPNIYRDNYEFGQITQKIRRGLNDASENQSWNLTANTSYDDNVYVGNECEVKLFYNTVAWEIRDSITNKQVKQAFTSASELGNFVSMIFTNVQNSIQLKVDSLIMMVICNYASVVLNTNNTVRAVNLLAGYKAIHTSSTLDENTAIYDADFLKYATGIIKKYQKKLATYSTLFNESGTKVHTPKELQHLVLLDEFADNCDTYLSSGVFHDEFVKLPYHETVPMWQGQGTDTSFEKCSTIKITNANGDTVDASYVVGMLFDHDAVGINSFDESVETHYVKSAQFTNYWWKRMAQYFNDLDENFVVFYLKDE